MFKHSSINRSFKLVWSDARGAYIVAPESAGGRTKSCISSNGRRAARLARNLAFAAGLAWSSGGIFDAVAQISPANSNTSVDNNPNGVPVINISTPNAAGLSHNRFTSYNVDPSGVVLNNINTAAGQRSQLAGHVYGNMNLIGGGTASVILNEVVSPNRSLLRGFTEVAGAKADVVVVNPYGITCSGCGFINTDRVTLATGQPTFNPGGGLTGFAVTGGDVLVKGTGLTADESRIKVLDIVTRSFKSEGPLMGANDLQIVVGNNTWSYGTRVVTGRTAESGTAPVYAIDSTVLGGIYANTIRLISTEAGVGVRMLGEVGATTSSAAAGEERWGVVSLESAGKIELNNKIVAAKELSVTSTATGTDAITLDQADLFSSGDMRFTASGGGMTMVGGKLVASNALNITAQSLSDTAASSSDADASKRYATNALGLNVSGDAVLAGEVSWTSGGNVIANLGSLTVAGIGAVVASEEGTLNIATRSNMALNAALVSASYNLSLTAQGSISIAADVGQGVQSANGDMNITAGNGLNNQGKITAHLGSLTAHMDGTLTNGGELYSKGNMTLADGPGSGTMNLHNSGAKLLTDGRLNIVADNVTNAGNMQGALGTNLQANSLGNSGVLIASSDAAADAVTWSLGSLTNSGTLQTRNDLTLNLTSPTLNNNGEILSTSGDLTIDAKGAALQINNNNGGTLQANKQLNIKGNQVNLNNAAGAKIIADDLEITATTLTNAGESQGGTSDSNINVSGDISNSGTLILATKSAETGVVGSGNLTANKLDNRGTLQSAGAANLTVIQDMHNFGTGTITADRLAIRTNNFINDVNSRPDGSGGLTQGGTGASTLEVTNTVSNRGTLTLATRDPATSAVGSGTITAHKIDNWGLLQSTGAASLSVAETINNQSATARIMAGTNLTIRGTDSGYAVSNAGRIQAGDHLDIKGQGGGNGVVISIGPKNGGNEGGIILANTADLNASNLSIADSGMLSSLGNMTVNVQTLTQGGSGAAIVGSSAGSGTTAIAIADPGVFTNIGAIHSGNDLVLNAANIINSNTGGISANRDLTLTATGAAGGISNSGALYAGNHLRVTAANGTITNVGTLSGEVGTIDSGGDMTLTSQVFVNNSAIRGSSDIKVTAAVFKNEVAGGDTRVDGPPGTTNTTMTESILNEGWGSHLPIDERGYNYLWRKFYVENWSVDQSYSGGTPSYTPQLIGGRKVDIDGFSGPANGNRGAIISAPTVTISGAGTFTQDNLALSRKSYQRSYQDWIGCNSIIGYRCADEDGFTNTRWARKNESGDQLVGAETIGSIRTAGIYGTTVTLKGVALESTSPIGTTIRPKGAEGGTASTLASPTGPKINVVPVGGRDSIMFGGVVIRVPTNPNGFFVISPNPGSRYLVETNPLFTTSNNAYGSSYLAQQLGLNTDSLIKRLGDANYEAYLIRQQLIVQTGNNLLAGYQSEASLLQTMMRSSASEALALGFVWGEPPSNDKLAQLTKDIVWMVAIEVAGQQVLTPVVYLAKTTIAKIQTGSVIAADNINMQNMTSVTNTGGTISATNNVSITASGDITNSSGTIQGGNVALTSTAGSIINQTLVQSDCNAVADSCTSVVGRTAGISATGSLSLDAKQDIRVIGANVSAGGDASLKAGNDIVFDTTATTTRGTDRGKITEGNASVQWDNVKTETKNTSSTLTVGGNLILNSGRDTKLYSATVNVTGNLDATSGGQLVIGTREDTTEIKKSSTTNSLFGATLSADAQARAGMAADPAAGAGPTTREFSQGSYSNTQGYSTGGTTVGYADNRDISRGSAELMSTTTISVNDVDVHITHVVTVNVTYLLTLQCDMPCKIILSPINPKKMV